MVAAQVLGSEDQQPVQVTGPCIVELDQEPLLERRRAEAKILEVLEHHMLGQVQEQGSEDRARQILLLQSKIEVEPAASADEGMAQLQVQGSSNLRSC